MDTLTYIFEKQTYVITESAEIHHELQNDPQFLSSYLQNLNHEEKVNLDTNLTAGRNENYVDHVVAFKWDKNTTKLLIHEYKHRLEQFRSPKTKKKDIWGEIKNEFLNEGYTVSEEDLDRKWRNMKKTFTTIRDNKKSTGSARIAWEHYDDFKEIYSTDNCINLLPTLTYIFGKQTYVITESAEIHQELQNDTQYLRSYLQNLNHEEKVNLENNLTAGRDENYDDHVVAFKWDRKTTKLLIHEYKHRLEQFRSPKTRKKDIWGEIKNEFLNEGYTVSEEDLDRKWRNMKKTFTTIRDNKKSTGSARIAWEHYDDFKEIYSTDNCINLLPTLIYIFGKQTFVITESAEIHQELQNDPQYLRSYLQNLNHEEKVNLENNLTAGKDENYVDHVVAFKWDKNTTKLLIHEYKHRLEQFRSPKTKKKEIWGSIKNEFLKKGYTISEEDLDRKWRNLKKTFTNIRDNKNSTGSTRIAWEHYNDFEEIYSTDNCINLLPTLTYIFENQTYVITESAEIHHELQNDPEYLRLYLENLNHEEKVNLENNTTAGRDENYDDHVVAFKWDRKTTKLLIHEYKHRLEQFRSPKTRKKDIWGEIKNEFLNEGYTVSEEDLDRKWRNMKKTFTTIRDNKKSTGSARIAWEHYDDFKEIYSTDNCIKQLPTRSFLNTDSAPSTSQRTSSLTDKTIGIAEKRKIEDQADCSEFVNKRARNENISDHNRKFIEVEEKRMEILERLAVAIERSNAIQEERNVLLKSFITE